MRRGGTCAAPAGWGGWGGAHHLHHGGVHCRGGLRGHSRQLKGMRGTGLESTQLVHLALQLSDLTGPLFKRHSLVFRNVHACGTRRHTCYTRGWGGGLTIFIIVESTAGAAFAGTAASFRMPCRLLRALTKCSVARVVWWFAPPTASSSGIPKRSRSTSSEAPCHPHRPSQLRFCSWSTMTVDLPRFRPSPSMMARILSRSVHSGQAMSQPLLHSAGSQRAPAVGLTRPNKGSLPDLARDPPGVWRSGRRSLRRCRLGRCLPRPHLPTFACPSCRANPKYLSTSKGLFCIQKSIYQKTAPITTGVKSGRIDFRNSSNKPGEPPFSGRVQRIGVVRRRASL